VVIAIAAGVTIWATGASGSSGFRTATATKQTVEQTLGLSATVEPIQESAADFQVAGTVSKVNVAVGQTVKAGQALASLTTSTLKQDVTLAQTTLAAAKAQLSENELDEAASTASTTAEVFGPSTPYVLDASVTTPTTTPTSTPSGSAPGGKKPTGGKKKPTTGGSALTQAQQAVVSAQRTADADSEQAAATLAEAQTACGGATAPTTTTTLPTSTTTTVPTSSTTSSSVPTTTSSSVPTSTPPSVPTTAPSSVPTSAPSSVPTSTASSVPTSAAAAVTADTSPHRPGPPASTTTTTTTVGTPGSTSGGSSACAGALASALAAQQQVSTDQRAVSTAETALAKILSTTATSTGSKTGTGTTTGGSGTGGTGTSTGKGSTGSGTTGSGTSGTGSTSRTSTGTTGPASDSAEQLATDQATIDADQASLIEAQESLANAVLTSPISGTVAVVDLAADQAVSAGSTTSSITVINSGSFDATASLTSTQVAQVKVGDTALVTVDGVTGTLSGTVSRVGPVNSSSSGYTYPLVVALPAGAHGISGGSTAQVRVVLHQVTYALAVPTSAVHTTGANASYVMVLKAGKETRTTVSVGAVGSAYTQITSGLEVGTPVVLADLSTPIPTSSNATTTGRAGGRGLTGGAGGFTGGGGGFTGGGGGGFGGAGG
jgi:multidrug efflux pump subunit AcrA (membrane-fusion protein)